MKGKKEIRKQIKNNLKIIKVLQDEIKACESGIMLHQSIIERLKNKL